MLTADNDRRQDARWTRRVLENTRSVKDCGSRATWQPVITTLDRPLGSHNSIYAKVYLEIADELAT